jgi:hypothetical protein
MFVRDPTERILSGYLDKGLQKNSSYLKKHCCPRARDCAAHTFEEFLNITEGLCHRDPHRMASIMATGSRVLAFVNFIRNLGFVDATKLVTNLRAWQQQHS